MTDNAADRKSIRRREKQAQIADAQRAAVITNVMSTVEGRHWLWDILASCHCFSTTFNGDALTSAFAEGQRAVGLSILANIMLACPDQYLQAQRESNVRDATDERRSSTESDRGDTESSSESLDDGGNLNGEDPYARQLEGTYSVHN